MLITIKFKNSYKVTQLVNYLGWVDSYVESSLRWEGGYCCFLLPKQDDGMYHILINPTKVFSHQSHPVFYLVKCRDSVGVPGVVDALSVLLVRDGLEVPRHRRFVHHPYLVLWRSQSMT